jgi:hypothetical protein
MLRMQIGLSLCLMMAAITGCPSSSKSSGSDGGGTSKLTPAEVAAGGCSKQSGSSGGSTCTGQAEYQACLETMCASQYSTCLGANYKSGDFTGGTCATYLTCVKDAPDSCSNTCQNDSACMTCLTTDLGNCALNSGCISKLNCSTGGAGSGGGAGISGNGKTCKDLDACCASLSDASQKSMCMQSASAVKAGGDAVCGQVVTIYCP